MVAPDQGIHFVKGPHAGHTPRQLTLVYNDLPAAPKVKKLKNNFAGYFSLHILTINKIIYKLFFNNF